jgi:hypothetical protein
LLRALPVEFGTVVVLTTPAETVGPRTAASVVVTAGVFFSVAPLLLLSYPSVFCRCSSSCCHCHSPPSSYLLHYSCSFWSCCHWKTPPYLQELLRLATSCGLCPLPWRTASWLVREIVVFQRVLLLLLRCRSTRCCSVRVVFCTAVTVDRLQQHVLNFAPLSP